MERVVARSASSTWLVGTALVVVSMGLTTCGDSGAVDDMTGSQVDGTVLVFAAASLTDAFAAIETSFETANPGADVQLNLAGSSALREQVLEGAPADVFASANPSNMEMVAAAGEVAGEPRAFARNRMQIVVPAGNPGGVAGLDDLADDDLLVGLCAEGVPCGDLGRDVLAASGVDASLDTNEPDVRALLTKVGVGELDAGLVYATDVSAAGDLVEGIEIPAEVNTETTYPIAVLAQSPNPGGGRAFVDFVLSAAGQDVLAGFGFGPA